MSKQIVGVYINDQAALAAVEDLIDQGYNRSDISVVAKNASDVTEVGRETETKTEEGLATGAAAGGILGGLAGILVGAGALAIPGIGPLVAAGPLAGALSGAALGAGSGGLAGALIGMGIPEDDAAMYEGEIKNGKILVLIESDAVRHTQNGTMVDTALSDLNMENNTLTNDTIGMNGQTPGTGIPAGEPNNLPNDRNRKPY